MGGGKELVINRKELKMKKIMAKLKNSAKHVNWLRGGLVTEIKCDQRRMQLQ